MKRTKEIAACIIALIILVFTMGSVFATNTPVTSVNSLFDGNNTLDNTDDNTNDNYQQIPIAPTNNTDTPNVAGPTNNSNTNSTNTTVPYTGLNNTSIFIIIGICGISAIYAYKKIRDYNIK